MYIYVSVYVYNTIIFVNVNLDTNQQQETVEPEQIAFDIATNIIEKLITVTVSLPMVTSVVEIELDTLPTRILLSVPGTGHRVTIPLPKTIDPDSTKARFIKKKTQLVVIASYS